MPRRSKRQHRASVPTRLASAATGEAIQKGLYSIARRGRRMKETCKGAEGVRAVAPCALIGTLKVYEVYLTIPPGTGKVRRQMEVGLVNNE